MNLAIEYFLRTGELKYVAKPPYSLFLNRVGGGRAVVTIHVRHGHPEHAVVKQWCLGECPPEQPVPEFCEHIIARGEVFTSEHTVVPQHELLWYREEPFEAGSRQSADGIEAVRQAREYRQTLERFLNSDRHRQAREDWLWEEFVRVYRLDAKAGRSQAERTKLLTEQPKHRFAWLLWKKYLLDFSAGPGEPAGELLFQGEYVALASREGREVKLLPDDRADSPPGGWNPFIQWYMPARHGFFTLSSTTTAATSGSSAWEIMSYFVD